MDNKMLAKLMEKKKGQEMDPRHKEAKMSVLKDLVQHMDGMLGDNMKNDGLKKVTVASNTPEGLQHGLSKAEELVQQHGQEMDGESEDEEETPEHEAEESPLAEKIEDEMEAQSDKMSMDDIQDIEDKIEELERRKIELMKR